MTDRLEEVKISSEKVFEGKILKLFFDKVMLPNKKMATREKVWHPGAVAVVPLTATEEIILIRQFRYPVGEVLVEIPAGKLDSGEIPLDCAKRELHEEVGATGGNLVHLTSFYTTPGFSNEFLHLFLALNFEKKENNPDEDEFLEVISLPLEECVEWVFEGKINDAKSIIGILMADEYLRNHYYDLNNKFER
jgi:ADP-ribose pyrophosphatase